MSETRTTQAAASPEVARIVADTKARLDGRLRRIGRLVRANGFADPFPPAVFSEIGAARRDAIAGLGAILRLKGDDPAKQLALTWLSYVAAGLTDTHTALREQRLGAPTARKTQRLAQSRLKEVGTTFLKLDRVLGCPHGCKETP